MGLQITKDNYDRWAWQRRAVTDFPIHNSKFQAARDPIRVGRVNYSEQDKNVTGFSTPGYIIAYIP